MSRILMATWDGAGNLVPTLALARRLARRGHDVRLLGHRSIDARCGAHGWRFHAYAHASDFYSLRPGQRQGDMSTVARDLWCSTAVADDVHGELTREPADILIADCMLLGALSAGQALDVPAVALFHGAFALFRRGPLADLMTALLAPLNDWRRAAGLAGAAAIADIHDACTLSLVATPKEFEPEMRLPPNVRFVGPLLDPPPLVEHWSNLAQRRSAEASRSTEMKTSRREPLVVVSFSTSEQGQLPVLQRIVAALEHLPACAVVTTGPAIDPASLRVPRNVEAARFVPHDGLLCRASLVVTHAGLGTVMAALTHGVPMLCMPIGRDQFFNAARVEALGAGRTIAADAGVDTITANIRQLLQENGVRLAARRLADVIAGYRNGAGALFELDRLSAKGALRRNSHCGVGATRDDLGRCSCSFDQDAGRLTSRPPPESLERRIAPARDR